MPEKTLKLKIGSDPEFSVLWNNQRVPANQVIENLFRGDSRRNGHSVRTEGGELGCDGCASTGELRPNPELDPIKAAANIGIMIQEFAAKGMGFDLSTLSLWGPIGGHVHLELPEGVSSSDPRLSDWHNKLMSFYMPVMMGEEKASVKLRCSNYGQITDWKPPEGSRRTIEVRVPTAEWITTRKLAESMLAYMAVVWHEVIFNPKNLPKELLVKSDKQKTALQDMAINEFGLVNQAILKVIAGAVRTFEMYPTYKDQIEYILKPDRVLADKRAVGYSIKEGWGFAKSTKSINKRLFLGSQKDVEVIDGETFGIYHNEDFRTGLYAEELRKKVSSGMKLNHTYYIFGLKKGIKGIFLSKEEKYYLTPEYATSSDITAITRTRSRMASKAGQYEKERTSLDFKKGHIRKEIDRAVCVGIPYEMREKQDLKAFLEAIWKFEKGELKAITLVPKERTPGKSPVQALIPEGDMTTSPVAPDHDSQAANYAVRAIDAQIREQDAEVYQEQLADVGDRLRAIGEHMRNCKIKRLNGRHTYAILGEVVDDNEQFRQGTKLVVFSSYDTGNTIYSPITVRNGEEVITLPAFMYGIHELEGITNGAVDVTPGYPTNFMLRAEIRTQHNHGYAHHTVPHASLNWNVPQPVTPAPETPAVSQTEQAMEAAAAVNEGHAVESEDEDSEGDAF